MSIDLREYAEKARDKIKSHASRAIDVLEEQLVSAKSPVRISKLKHRIQEWKNSLTLLEKKDGKEES